jgi:hypothetical protein
VWQGDLRRVYLDPHRPPPKQDMLAYIPEQHASPKCERALRGGTSNTPADHLAPWCDLCTTPHKAGATIRRTITGWKAA